MRPTLAEILCIITTTWIVFVQMVLISTHITAQKCLTSGNWLAGCRHHCGLSIDSYIIPMIRVDLKQVWTKSGVDQRYPFPRSQTVSLGLLHYDHLVPLSDIRSTLNACHHPYRCHWLDNKAIYSQTTNPYKPYLNVKLEKCANLFAISRRVGDDIQATTGFSIE